MVSIVELVLSSIFPLLLFLVGFSLQLILFRRQADGFGDQVLAAILLGTFSLVIPILFLGTIPGLLNPSFIILSALMATTTLAVALSRRRKLSLSFRPTVGSILENWWGAAAVIVFTFFVAKLALVLCFRAINDGDALYYWISMAKVFWRQSCLPAYDTYHFWVFTDAPALPILYAWSFSIANSINLNPYRLLPIPFFLAYPILAYSIANDLTHDAKASCLALILACLLPTMDNLMMFYAYYPDIFAATFAVSAIHFTLQYMRGLKERRAELVGVSLCLSALFKYPIGLIAVSLVTILILSNVSLRNHFRWLPLLLVGIGFFIAAASLVPLNQQVLYPVIPLTLVAVSAAALLTLFATPKAQIRLRDACVVATKSVICCLPLILWSARSLLIGGSFLGLGFLRLTPQSPIQLQAQQVWLELFGEPPLAERFSPLSPLGFLFHPWMNLYFFPISLALISCAFFVPKARFAILLLFASFFGYLTGYQHILTGRHMLVASYFLLTAISIGMMYLERRTRHSLTPLLVAAFGLTSLLQFATTSILLPYLSGNPIVAAVEWFTIPYTGSYDLVAVIIQFGVQILVLNGLVFLLVLAVRSSDSFARAFNRANTRWTVTGRQKKLLATIVFVSISALSLAPFGYYSVALSGGNLWNLEYNSTWHAADYDAANALTTLADNDDVVLTYGDVVISFLGWRVIDIYHNGLELLMPIFYSEDTNTTMDYLKALGVAFLLLPGSRHYLFSSFQRLEAATDVFAIATSNATSVLVGTYSEVWLLYDLK